MHPSLSSATHSSSVSPPPKHSKSHCHVPKVVCQETPPMNIDITGYFNRGLKHSKVSQKPFLRTISHAGADRKILSESMLNVSLIHNVLEQPCLSWKMTTGCLFWGGSISGECQFVTFFSFTSKQTICLQKIRCFFNWPHSFWANLDWSVPYWHKVAPDWRIASLPGSPLTLTKNRKGGGEPGNEANWRMTFTNVLEMSNQFVCCLPYLRQAVGLQCV